jgi:hypothetical protein
MVKAVILIAIAFAIVAVTEAVPANRRSLKHEIRARVGNSISCAKNKDCATCIKAKGKSKWRGDYDCNWNKVTNICGSGGQIGTVFNYHKDRIKDADWIKPAGDCSNTVDFEKQMTLHGLDNQAIQRMITNINEVPPLNYDDIIMEAKEKKTDLEKITAVAKLFKEVAVIDCEFSDYCKERCKAKTFASGPWSGCNLWTAYETGCKESGPIKRYSQILGPVNIKLGGTLKNNDDCIAVVGGSATNTQKNDCVLAATKPFWNFVADKKAAVCSTFAGAGMAALREAGVTGHLQWVQEPYYSMGSTAGHEFLLYGNTGTTDKPSEGTLIVDFWYQGLGTLGSQCDGACFTIQKGLKTINHVTAVKTEAKQVQSYMSENNLHTLYSVSQVTKTSPFVKGTSFTMEYLA